MFLTRLIAREDLVDLATSRLERDRLVTLTGPGGAGKTRLAVEVGARWSCERVVFVELASVEDPALISSTVSQALAWDDAEPAADLGAALRSVSSVPVLLVVDNCEHLLTVCRDLVGQALAACPQLRVLTTSRVPLGIPGEAIVRVGALSVPPAGAGGVADAAAYPAVELFVDRAQLHDPSFSLSERNISPVVDICRLVDGLPLAVELAAAHVCALSVHEVADRLRRDVLRLGVDSEPRRPTLEHVLRWSYELLDTKAQELLRALSVFVDGFTLEAAEAICPSATLEQAAVYPTLKRLVDHSLVQRTDVAGGTRFDLYRTVRTFAAEIVGTEQPAGAASDVAARRPAFLLVREGDTWAVGAGGDVSRLKHAKGLSYLRSLIEACGDEIHTLELATTYGGPQATVSASEAEQLGLQSKPERSEAVIDGRALSAYRQRFRDLQEDLAEAQQNRDPERESRVKQEMAFLADELGRATGLGGRARSETSQSEKARVAVTKAIRSAIQRVIEVEPEIGAHLDAAVKTGTFCSYRPSGGNTTWKTR